MANHAHLLGGNQSPHGRLFRVHKEGRAWPDGALLDVRIEDRALVNNAHFSFIRENKPLVSVKADVRVVGRNEETG